MQYKFSWQLFVVLELLTSVYKLTNLKKEYSPGILLGQDGRFYTDGGDERLVIRFKMVSTDGWIKSSMDFLSVSYLDLRSYTMVQREQF